jgi:peptidase S41-like protein
MTRAAILMAVVVTAAAIAQVTMTGGAVSKDERRAVIARAADELERGYVFADLGGTLARTLRAKLADGSYDAIASAGELADALTRDLRSIAKDGHLQVVTRSSFGGLLAGGGPRTAIDRVERLAGNVGYLKIDGFPPAEEIGAPLDRAMTTLKDTAALVLDLRRNGGGAPDGAMYLAGFFFATPTLVARIYSRLDESTTEMRTADVAGPRYLGKPLYILTSRRTFSAGEAAAYHLKHVAHAITVGEPTGGGAHRVRSVDLDDRFALTLPFTRPINVVTNADWEGTGVTPELPSSAEDALAVAHLAALRSLPASPERDAAIHTLEKR